ncbi:MAG: tRNA (guanine(26)-N(2))-dimethyltransferase [Acidilobaceae archaeon]
MYWVLREGRVLVKVPPLDKAVAEQRLEPAWLPVFYNPRMEFNRDISVVALQVYVNDYAPRKPVIGVEPLSATGVRALRYAIEVEDVLRVYASDIDYDACKLIEENVSLNKAWDKVSIYCGDANALMRRLREAGVPVLFVDLDPYGSPVFFLDSALALVGNGGLLAATATDTAVLEGSKSSAALRKYWARLRKIPQSREVAIRALLAHVARIAAMHDRYVEPLLSLWVDYYVRVFVRVGRGARRATRMLEDKIRYLLVCNDTGYVSFDESEIEGCHSVDELGPLWAGELGSRLFAEKLGALVESRFDYLRTRRRILRILGLVLEELELQEAPAQRLDYIASRLRRSVPSRDSVMNKLRGMGFKAVRTHFDPLAVRTDAPMRELVSAIAEA